MKSEMIILAYMAMGLTLFSPSYAVRGLMGDKTSHPVAMPAGSIRDHVGACQPTIPSFLAGCPHKDETVTSVTAGATRRVYSCPKIQLGKNLSIIEEG